MTAAVAREPGWLKMQRAVFAACKANGIDENARHAIVQQLTGRESLSDCNAVELGRVLNHLNRGRVPSRKYDGRKRSHPPVSREAQMAKIVALLAELHRVTSVPHTLRYADAIARKNGYGENVDFCDMRGLRYIIGALTRTLAFKQRNL